MAECPVTPKVQTVCPDEKTAKVFIGKDVSKMSNVELHGFASPKTTA